MNKDAKIIGIWGGRGSGKSTKIKEYIKSQDLRHYRGIIALDPLGEYKDEGFSEVTTLKRGLYPKIKKSWNKPFCFSVNLMHNPDPAGLLRDLSEGLFAIQEPYKAGRTNKKIMLVLDEMSLLVPNSTMKPDERQFLNACNLGRHYGIEIIGASQRLAQVHTDFRGNCAEHYFFRMAQAVDLGAAQKVIGKRSEELAGLAPHEYLHWSDSGIKKGKNRATFNRKTKND